MGGDAFVGLPLDIFMRFVDVGERRGVAVAPGPAAIPVPLARPGSHVGEDREELQDGGGLDDPLKDATSAGDARTGRPLADPPRAADRLITPESDVDDLGSLEYEVRQPLQLLRRRSPRASSLTHPHTGRAEAHTPGGPDYARLARGR
jgi:hypothetical protein